MDFIDHLRGLAARVAATKDMLQTEEATKNAMVMPFIQVLGYNVFDPLEVTPELVSDIGTKKGEKVDYAILRDGKPIVLFECKKAGADLNINHASQLFRYFHVTAARFGVLTNGHVYLFFTDLEQPNKMDQKPFFEFNILDFKDRDVDELKKFAKTVFDIDAIMNTANDLKYTRAIQNRLADWATNPSEDFVRLVSCDLLGNKRFTPAIKDQFTLITKRAFEQLIGEQINDRLKAAMSPESTPTPEAVATVMVVDAAPEAQAVTSAEETEGFHIVKSIVRSVVGPKRVFMRDAQTYCAILLDDNNRKPICRLRFNNVQKMFLGLMNGKDEERVAIASVDDIYNYADRITAAASAHMAQGEK